MTTSLSDFGISLTLPDGGYGEIFRVADGVHDSGLLVHFANSPLILGDRNGFAGPVRQTDAARERARSASVSAPTCRRSGSCARPTASSPRCGSNVSPGARGDRLEQFFTSADAVRIQKDMRREGVRAARALDDAGRAAGLPARRSPDGA